HGERVPFLSAQEAMEHYDFAQSPFRFTRQARAWDDAPRMAAINAFADGGTNAHVLVEVAPAEGNTARMPLDPPVFRRVALPPLDTARRIAPIDDAPAALSPSQTAVPGFWERYG
ncbi:hypothetical protein, partial [Xanthomonas arboricola]|uniref:hypothetical protein n=1 Tax=Xanthomonas arboricola TaxID=56448 RepID=UPI00161196F9